MNYFEVVIKIRRAEKFTKNRILGTQTNSFPPALCSYILGVRGGGGWNGGGGIWGSGGYLNITQARTTRKSSTLNESDTYVCGTHDAITKWTP